MEIRQAKDEPFVEVEGIESLWDQWTIVIRYVSVCCLEKAGGVMIIDDFAGRYVAKGLRVVGGDLVSRLVVRLFDYYGAVIVEIVLLVISRRWERFP